MARNTFACADIRFRESNSAPTSSSSKTVKPTKAVVPYIEPKFRRGAPEEADGLKVWQCRRDSNFRAFGNQLFHDKNAHPRFYATKAQIKHQRKNVLNSDAKAKIGIMQEESRRNQRAKVVEAKLNNSLPEVRFSGFMGCSLKNKKPILQYQDAEKDDLDFTFSGVVSVDADIRYNCSFFPSDKPKQIDMRRYNDYVDLFVNYSGKQRWELSRPYRLTEHGKPMKAKVFWTNAREFRAKHPLSIKREWNQAEEIVDAPVEPDFIEPTGLDKSFDDAEAASCAETVIPVVSAADTVLPAEAQKSVSAKVLPAEAQVEQLSVDKVVIDLMSVETSDEAESFVSEHSLPPPVLIDTDSSSDDSNLNITIPEFPEAIFADAIGVFDETEDNDQVVPLPWAAANSSMDVEIGENSSFQAPLVVIPPTAVPANNVLSVIYKHPFIRNEPQTILDDWETDEEHETYLLYGTELPSSPYEFPTSPLEGLSVFTLKSKCLKERLTASGELIKVSIENLQLTNQNRDLKLENEKLRNATSNKTISNLNGRINELEESNELWRGRALSKATRATNLSTSMSAVYDILDDTMWLRGATPLNFTVNSDSTFHPRFGDGKQVLAKQIKKNESRNCPNAFDKCDPTSKHQCFNCISSFRISACMAIVLEGLLKNEMSIVKFQRLSTEPSTLSLIEARLAIQKRPSETSTPLTSKPKQSRISDGKLVLSNDLTKVNRPLFTTPKRSSQSSITKNINDTTVDERNTQDFEIDVHASDSDAEYLSANE